MKLMVASYNNGATDWNAEAEETAFRSYTLDHSFNGPARCTIVLGDADGSILRKYNADANDVYVGVGKVTLEDPTTTADVFFGRIIRVVGDSAERTVKLECRDWLDQLDEEIITYDMREPLNNAGLRQSDISSDVDGTCLPVSQTFMSAQARDGAAFTDETTAANEDTADDMTLLPAVPAANDAYYFGFDVNMITQMNLYISTAGVGVWTITWEYQTGIDGVGEAWTALPSISDGSSGFTVVGENTISWADVSGTPWRTYSVNGIDKFWIRGRVSSYTSIVTQPLGQQVWQPQTLYDDDIEDFTADEWNGKYLLFPAESSGTQVITSGPYADTVTGTETAGSYADTWLDDTNFHDLTRNGGTLVVDYDFHINAEMGSLYSSGPSEGKIYLSFICYNDLQAANLNIYVLTAAEAALLIGVERIDTTTTAIKRITATIPTQYLSSLIDTLGEVTIRLEAQGGPGQIVYLDVYQCLLSLTYVVSGTSTSYPILDTTTNTIVTEANLTYNGLGAWECMKYCVAKEIYLHLEAATGPILGGDDVVTLTCAVGNVENTTGVSTRQYKNRTRLQILQDLAAQDGAVFFIALGGSTVTYQKTFGADTATLTDSVVDNWQSLFDYSTMSNDALVYGARLGTYEVFQQSQHAASIAKYRATKSTVITSTGITSDIDAKSIADGIVAKDNDILQMVQCTISGFDTTHRLGTVVEITSSYLWSTAAKDYVVTRWAYDSKAHKSYLTLHPVSSIGFMPIVTADVESDTIKRSTKKTEIDKYIPLPVTNEVA